MHGIQRGVQTQFEFTDDLPSQPPNESDTCQTPFAAADLSYATEEKGRSRNGFIADVYGNPVLWFHEKHESQKQQRPLHIYILAGQNNQVGFGSKQHMKQLLATRNSRFAHLYDAKLKRWTVREHVFVTKNHDSSRHVIIHCDAVNSRRPSSSSHCDVPDENLVV